MNPLTRWFTKQPKPVQQVRIIDRDVFRCTLNEWRATPDLLKIAAGALRSPDVRRMLDVLRFCNLANYSCEGTLEQRAIHLARCEGYMACLNDFEAMAIEKKATEDIPEDYAKDDEV